MPWSCEGELMNMLCNKTNHKETGFKIFNAVIDVRLLMNHKPNSENKNMLKEGQNYMKAKITF